MELTRNNKEKLHLEYENDKPVMKMESGKVSMTFHFAEEPPTLDVKQVIVDILTSQYTSKVSE